MLESLHTLGFTLSAFARPQLGRSRLKRYQWRKLQEIVRYAAAEIPFYRDCFRRHGFDPASLQNPEDIRNIPILDKRGMTELRESFSREEIARRHLVEHKTSGSTGAPIRILRSPAEERRLNMLRWRMQMMLGLRPGDRLAKVKTTWEPLSKQYDRLQGLAGKVGFLDARIFDCFENPAESHRQLLDFQPHVLSGYPGALVRIALTHIEQGRELKCLRRVGSGGESLLPNQRQILEEAFGVPVYDVYGSSECNLAAWQCDETDHYHVNDDGILLEVCRNGVPVASGETGEVVITSLHSRTMPIIRYRLGDLAEAGPLQCPCGSPFSTIRRLQGRIADLFDLPDGRVIHPFEVLNEIVVEASDWIAEYQLVQTAPGCFFLECVPRRPAGEERLARLRAAVLAVLGPTTTLVIKLTDRIARSESGKLHFCRALR
ncbi:MAG: hypothetical protein KJN78_09370 [Gammaproteobacteria bacterium]|nr:hypothetical protein [Gammaproteobacteria bacterium]